MIIKHNLRKNHLAQNVGNSNAGNSAARKALAGHSWGIGVLSPGTTATIDKQTIEE